MSERMVEKIDTPELDKMKAAMPDSRVLSEFLDWMDVNDLAVCDMSDSYERIMPYMGSREKLLADFFEIDLKKVEEERRAILDAHRKEHNL